MDLSVKSYNTSMNGRILPRKIKPTPKAGSFPEGFFMGENYRPDTKFDIFTLKVINRVFNLFSRKNTTAYFELPPESATKKFT